MAKHLLPVAHALFRSSSQRMGQNLQKYWFRAVLVGAAAYLVYAKDVAIDFELSNTIAAAAWLAEYETPPVAEPAQPASIALLHEEEAPPAPAARPVHYEQPANVSRLANTYSNLTPINKSAPAEEPAAKRAAKRQKQLQYVKRFGTVAQAEMEKFGIPASITLAQGLLESNVGESRLATENNNHFGVKCFSKTCQKGHCSNYTDDTHKDFFRKYKSAWESYRAHSQLLKQSDRYKPLFELKPTDYRGWAKGLKAAGYATDQAYAEKLINLIEDLNLQQYDR